MLSVHDHRQILASFQYVYPVVSRRAGGLSIGLNLNPNRACNWQCVYCQVEGLTRGGAPHLDLERLEWELNHLLEAVLEGDFMEKEVPEPLRILQDIAFSGDGEPTSSPQFLEVLALLEKTLKKWSLLKKIKVILITNGSLLHRERVQTGLTHLAKLGGEVWFKLDRGSAADMKRVNQTQHTPERALSRLPEATSRCPTWIQSCFFAWDGAPPSEAQKKAYIACLQKAKALASPPQGVLLYGLARTSHQPQAIHLSALSAEWMGAWAHRIEQETGFSVRWSA